VAVSTCDPPHEQWLAGLGQVLGLFLVPVGATVVAQFLFMVVMMWQPAPVIQPASSGSQLLWHNSCSGGVGWSVGIWVWLGAYLVGSLLHRPPDTSLWCSLPQVKTSHPILMGRRRRVFGERDLGPTRT
jgi:hypothetical protein